MPIFLALVALLPVAFAQAEEPEGPHITYRPVTELDLEEVTVEGSVVRPPMSFIQEAKHKGFPPMIALRLNFDEDLRASVDAVR
jgi:hypothetical protein